MFFSSFTMDPFFTVGASLISKLLFMGLLIDWLLVDPRRSTTVYIPLTSFPISALFPIGNQAVKGAISETPGKLSSSA